MPIFMAKIKHVQIKDTYFHKKSILKCGNRLVSLERPLIMGILNITPDSFYDGGRYTSRDSQLQRVEEMLLEGAAIIDIGASSSRPGSKQVTEEEEKARLFPALEVISSHFPEAILSVDTYFPEIAARVVKEYKVSIINDISGGNWVPGMPESIGKLGAAYVLMHIQGRPDVMQQNPEYADVTAEVTAYFSNRIRLLKSQGVVDIILDPGFGFGKNNRHNFSLLNSLHEFRMFELPILVGISRKSMVWKSLQSSPAEALNGSTVLNTIALLKGAGILRVHDVKEAAECITLVEMLGKTGE
jgi:dihydropteroate synthase